MKDIYEMAARQAAKAKDGALITAEASYRITFNHCTWCYDCFDIHNNHIVSFNTKSLSTAKRWLREHLGV